MGFLSGLIDRAKGLFDQPVPTKTNAIQTNSFDREDWEDVLAQSPALRDDVDRLRRVSLSAGDLMGDLHAGLFKNAPRLTDRAEMAPTHELNRQVMQEVMDLKEVRILRQHTVGDKYAAAVGMRSVNETVVETVERVREVRKEAENARQQAEQRAREAAQQAQELAQMAQQAQTPLEQQAAGEALQQALDQFDQAQQQAQEAQQQAQQQAQNAIERARMGIAQAASDATRALDEEQALASGFGVEEGELQKMSVQERMDLASKLKDNRLAKFIKLLGQFKMVQQAESRKRVVNAASEVHGVTQSDDITRMISAEYLNFADESLQTLMLARMVEHQLNTYEVRGKEKLGQGPIIVVADESGSMTTEDVAGGSREAWAKALALAMLDHARQRKRDFVYIGFAYADRQRVVEFPGGVTTLPKVLEMTEGFLGGGTHYEKPLMMALEHIQKRYDDKQLERPDIVFISDDCYGRMSEDFMEEYLKLKHQVRITTYGIALGCSSSGAMEQISDNVREVTELVSDPRNVGDLFRTI